MASAAILKRIAAVVKTPTPEKANLIATALEPNKMHKNADKMPANKENSGLSKFCLSIISRDLLRKKTCVAINSKNRPGSLYPKTPNSKGIKSSFNRKQECPKTRLNILQHIFNCLLKLDMSKSRLRTTVHPYKNFHHLDRSIFVNESLAPGHEH